MSKTKSTLINVILGVVIGVGGFYGGIYYGIKKTDVYIENLMGEFEKISDDVSAFSKISDPKTIRAYVDELNKILDDVKFLNKVIETGQLADEALDDFFDESQGQIKEVNERIVALHKELLDVVEKFTIQSNVHYENAEKNMQLIDKSGMEVKAEIGKLYDKIDELYKELEEVSIILDQAKETFLGKYIIK